MTCYFTLASRDVLRSFVFWLFQGLVERWVWGLWAPEIWRRGGWSFPGLGICCLQCPSPTPGDQTRQGQGVAAGEHPPLWDETSGKGAEMSLRVPGPGLWGVLVGDSRLGSWARAERQPWIWEFPLQSPPPASLWASHFWLQGPDTCLDSSFIPGLLPRVPLIREVVKPHSSLCWPLASSGVQSRPPVSLSSPLSRTLHFCHVCWISTLGRQQTCHMGPSSGLRSQVGARGNQRLCSSHPSIYPPTQSSNHLQGRNMFQAPCWTPCAPKAWRAQTWSKNCVAFSCASCTLLLQIMALPVSFEEPLCPHVQSLRFEGALLQPPNSQGACDPGLPTLRSIRWFLWLAYRGNRAKVWSWGVCRKRKER